ncbi:hypothetical protein [Flexithrix dorotheae]|uniref:hypothetical protein n=1 Tax=Flexithrix dorotheae TaxID=70993 RepID=UPI000364C85F|nr:hypothetical protein [Flexithrix dorotheae]
MKLFDPLKFVDYNIDGKNAILYYQWKKESETMAEDDYKLTMAFLLNQVKEYDLKHVIANQVDKKFTIGLSIQDWVANIIRVVSDFGVVKIAIIESQEFIAQLSLEQLVEASKKMQHKATVLFFKTKKEAYQWVLEEE